MGYRTRGLLVSHFDDTKLRRGAGRTEADPFTAQDAQAGRIYGRIDDTTKSEVMKRTTLCLLFAVLPTFLTSAAPILVETFSYPDGPLVTGSAGKWASHSGTANQVDVASGKVNLTQAESEDVNAGLTGAPYTGPTLYASFIVNFSTLPAGSGGYFAHFKD